MVELGLGLLSIGRPWGARGEAPPPPAEAIGLLEKAVSLGVRFFDTAPAYGESEAIFGRFLRDCREKLLVSTKMGESWDAGSGTSLVDHSYAALVRSIERSLERLGSIDLLQVHKATAENLASRDVQHAIEYARSRGVACFGASVSDLAAANAAMRAPWCSYLQFPFNRARTELEPIFALARERGVKLVINRPFAMGQIPARADAFAFIRSRHFAGVVLTGTKSPVHLAENYAAFQAS